MSGLIAFMRTGIGRIARIVLGLVLIVWGFFFSGGTTLGTVLGVVGFVPVVMGAWGPCLLQLLPGSKPTLQSQR
ncbi:MAG: YgaP-like transmembrane domain [Chloroflexota bacterium]